MLPCMVDGIDWDANSWNIATRCCRLVQYCCSTFSACLSKHTPDQSYKVTPKEIQNMWIKLSWSGLLFSLTNYWYFIVTKDIKLSHLQSLSRFSLICPTLVQAQSSIVRRLQPALMNSCDVNWWTHAASQLTILWSRATVMMASLFWVYWKY